jgi:hypothetical protein
MIRVGDEQEVEAIRGRQYFEQKDHIYGGTTKEQVGVFMGSPSAQRGAAPGQIVPLGYGRRYIGAKDHMWGGATRNDAPGSHGHNHFKDIDFEDGLARGIGHGKRHLGAVGGKDHIDLGGLHLTPGDKPGDHGHSKDDDWEDGLQRGMGHGRRRLSNGMDAMGALLTSPSERRVEIVRSPSAPALLRTGCADGVPSSRAAGVPSRYAIPPVAAAFEGVENRMQGMW